MEDGDLVTAALNAEEAFQSCARRFRIATLGGVTVRVVEYPEDPRSPINLGAAGGASSELKYWDMGDEKMAKDFIRLQCWKAAVQACRAAA